MGKKLRKALASCLALSMCASMLSVSASAAETTGTVEVETSAGNYTNVDVTITFDENTGDTTYTAEDVDTGDGIVNYNGVSNETTGESESEYTVDDGNYHAVGGSETTVEQDGISDPDGIKVDVSLTEGGQNTATGNASEEPTYTGNTKDFADEGDYDYTSTTVTGQASVTITTTDVKITEQVDTENTNMEHVVSDTTPTDDNDLVYPDANKDKVSGPGSDGVAPEMYLPGYEGEVVAPEGSAGDEYAYTYVGSGNTSKFMPAIVYTEPLDEAGKLAMYGENAYIKKNSVTYYYVGWLSDEVKATIAKDEDGNYVTDENGYILDNSGNRIFKEERTSVDPDGNTVYLHRFDNFGKSMYTEGWYEDGKWVEEVNGDKSFAAIWAGPQQFVLVDDNGNLVTAYCADVSTPTQDNFGYNVENLEDATYYGDDQAAMIRAIAANGYWGTVETDEEGNAVPVVGSLEAMKQNLRNAGFTEEDLASLNDGVALTATQMAIWSCSNKMSSIQFVNSYYSDWGVGDVPEEKEDEVKLLFKLYDYLMALDPVEPEMTTADTIINEDNFLKDMSVTVIEKAEDHENNKNASDEDDAYVTELSFALVVTPSTENGDDLVVKVIGADGSVLASGRIAGENKEGEDYTELTADENGNYSFKNIVMVEGEQNFNITLEGVQNLKEGVYLYSSEVRTDEETSETTSSQTLVGIASGKREVGVSMNLSFELSVEDEVVVTEHVWRNEWVSGGSNPPSGGETPPAGGETPPSGGETPPSGGELPPEEFVEIPEEDIPLVDVDPEEIVELPEEDIPLADVPKTGDASALWMLMSALSGSGLLGLAVLEKKRKED